MKFFVVGNSWSIPSDEAPVPVFDLLGLKTTVGESWDYSRCTSRIHH